MTKIQAHMFRQVFQAVVIIVGSLVLMALLAQGLSRTDLILENRQSALTYLYIVVLGSPQIVALLLDASPSASESALVSALLSASLPSSLMRRETDSLSHCR
jgi:undecaprenyl pyrophosphate phosphatase UppP